MLVSQNKDKPFLIDIVINNKKFTWVKILKKKPTASVSPGLRPY